MLNSHPSLGAQDGEVYVSCTMKIDKDIGVWRYEISLNEILYDKRHGLA